MNKARYCSVPGCQRYKTKNISLHHLPANIIEKNIWAQILKLSINNEVKNILVCSRHFMSTDFINVGKKRNFLCESGLNFD